MVQQPTKIALLMTAVAVSQGCGFLDKRNQEKCCPTDIRQQHCWSLGEDAVFDLPCGVDEAYHGHKATCWREWQAPGAVWRDEHCGPLPCATCQTPSHAFETVQPTPAPAEAVIPAPEMGEGTPAVTPPGLPALPPPAPTDQSRLRRPTTRRPALSAPSAPGNLTIPSVTQRPTLPSSTPIRESHVVAMTRADLASKGAAAGPSAWGADNLTNPAQQTVESTPSVKRPRMTFPPPRHKVPYGMESSDSTRSPIGFDIVR